MFDVLAHLELFASLDAAAAALEEARAAGVTDVVSAGTNPLVDELVPHVPAPRIHRAFGIHPENAARFVDSVTGGVKAAVAPRLPGAVAVGECGFDAREAMPAPEVQRAVFAAQAALAVERGLPLVVHGVRAPRVVLDVMEHARTLAGGERLRWVWHAFSGSLAIAHEAIAAGAVISIGAAVADEHHKKTREVAAALPLGALVVETDGPHAPLASLPRTLAAIARLRGARVDDVIRATTANARAVFGV